MDIDGRIGAYRDNNAKPWVLPVVKKVRLPTLHWLSSTAIVAAARMVLAS